MSIKHKEPIRRHDCYITHINEEEGYFTAIMKGEKTVCMEVDFRLSEVKSCDKALLQEGRHFICEEYDNKTNAITFNLEY